MNERKYSVQTLLLEVESVMYRHWPIVVVEGEVGQLQTPASGHAYLVLREGDAQLPAVVWRNDWRASAFKPGVGDRVIARGRLGLYSAQGRYQLYANVLRPAGEGVQARELAARRERLERDGLLDPRRKRPLPRFPSVIGLATSASGAALHDFLRVSRERYPAARILVAACQVQGPEAPGSVIRALELLCEDGRAEVIALARGGGSRADLSAFQDEALARWVAMCPIPVVSAVGHEIDTSLVDLVADGVAATPSAAALLILPDGPALAQKVDERAGAVARALERSIQRKRRDLAGLRSRLRHPRDRLAGERRRMLTAEVRLRTAAIRRVEVARFRLDRARARLAALSPLAVLARGYAIVSGPNGIVDRPEAVVPGDVIDVRVQGGRFEAEVLDRKR
jgi:exodeoxyribonuclease VII large subunit